MPECYLCGGVASTVDHVPPRSLFPADPANIIKLSAYQGCNQGASFDEEYIRTILAAMGYDHSSVARAVWEDKVKRSFERRPNGLRARLPRAVFPLEFRTAAGRVLGHFPGLGIDGQRASRVFRKIARGLYFNDCQRRISDAELLLFRDADVRIDFEVISRVWPGIDMGEGFRYKALHAAEGSLIWFEFYRVHWWLALTGEMARTYPHR
jgi:hypothetical protein